MKKAMIACAILCVISLLSTVGFAAALGTQAVGGLFGPSGVARQWWNEVHGNNISGQIGQQIQQEIQDDDDAPLQSTESLDFQAGETLTVRADRGDIRLVKGTGDRVEVNLQQYAYGQLREPVYTVSVQNDSEVTLSSAEQQGSGVKAVLEIRVPDQVKNITVSTGIGDIDATGITPGTLTATVTTGDAELEYITADTVTVNVTTGDVSVDRNTNVGALQIAVVRGEVDYDVPAATPFTLNYAVTTGTVEFDDGVQRSYFVESKRSGAGVSGKVTLSADGQTTQTVSVQIETGKLEVSNDMD